MATPNRTPVVAITEQDKNLSQETPQTTSQETPAIDLQDLSAAGPNNIHWINSSYSGVDVKVVAHLYGETDKEKKLEELKEAAAVSQEIVNGCYNWMSGESDVILRAQGGGIPRNRYAHVIVFKNTCFPSNGPTTDIESRAMTFLLANLFSHAARAMTGRGLLVNAGSERASELIHEQEQVAASLQTQIANADKMVRYSSSTVTLATLQTISLQSHREKYGVRTLGRSYVTGYTRGPRTIAGSMILTVFNEHALYKLIRAMDDALISGETHVDTNLSSLIPDQLPPIDLTLVFANEYGALSKMGMYGVEFVNDGMTMSIEDLMTESVLNFVARDVDIMTSVGLRKLNGPGREIYDMEGREVTTASSLYPASQDAYHDYIKRLGVRRAYKGR